MPFPAVASDIMGMKTHAQMLRSICGRYLHRNKLPRLIMATMYHHLHSVPMAHKLSLVDVIKRNPKPNVPKDLFVFGISPQARRLPEFATLMM